MRDLFLKSETNEEALIPESLFTSSRCFFWRGKKTLSQRVYGFIHQLKNLLNSGPHLSQKGL